MRLGAVLAQVQNGEEQVICYASRSLTDVERRYSRTEREALGIVWACERLHMYLYGTDFEILTDHKPLEFIYSRKSHPSARVNRWVLRLQPYRFTVRHPRIRKHCRYFISSHRPASQTVHRKRRVCEVCR